MLMLSEMAKHNVYFKEVFPVTV